MHVLNHDHDAVAFARAASAACHSRVLRFGELVNAFERPEQRSHPLCVVFAFVPSSTLRRLLSLRKFRAFRRSLQELLSFEPLF